MKTQYRRGLPIAAMALFMAWAPAPLEASEPASDTGEDTRILLSVGDHTAVDDPDRWRDELCSRLVDRLPGRCTDAGEDTTEDAIRYRADLSPTDEGLSLLVDRRVGDDFSTPLLNRRLSADAPSTGAVDTLEHHVIDARLDTGRTADHPPQWWYAAGLQTVALFGATIWYLSFDDLNSKDWDFAGLYSDDPDLELRPQSEVWRDFGGWRFDDNVMYLNTPLHPMAGAGYYLLGRGSNLGMWSSILVANLTSFVWEAGIEHQEVISLNDMMFTGVAGIPLGEFYHQFGQFFRSAEPTLFNQVMSWIFATPTQLHELFDGGGPMYLGERGDFGWPEETWHDFALRTGFGPSSARGTETDFETTRYDAEFDASAELNRLPDYRRQGEHDQWMAGPLRTELGVGVSAGGGDVYDWGLTGELDFAGYFSQDIHGDDGAEVGTSYFVGTGMSFRHDQHRFGDRLDRYGIAHLPGLVVDASWLAGPVDVRLRHGVHPDFSNIDSLAYPKYGRETGQTAGRTVLENERYYFGWGLSSLLGIEVNAGPVQAHWDWNFHWSRSIDSLDRFSHDQQRFGQDLDQYLAVTDTVSNHEVGALIQTPVPRLRTGIVGEYRQRTGSVDDGDYDLETRTSDMRGLGVIQMQY